LQEEAVDFPFHTFNADRIMRDARWPSQDQISEDCIDLVGIWRAAREFDVDRDVLRDRIVERDLSVPDEGQENRSRRVAVRW
jgi:hypothetical protein